MRSAKRTASWIHLLKNEPAALDGGARTRTALWSSATEEASRVEECSERKEAAQGPRDPGKRGRNTGELCQEVPGAAAPLRPRRQYPREQRLRRVVRVRTASRRIAACSRASEWTARHDTLDTTGQPRPSREDKRSAQ